MMRRRLVARRSTKHGGIVRAEWHGGAYVELTFGGATGPTEVINVWDDDHDRPQGPHTRAYLHAVLAEWIDEMDSDPSWPDWYQDYVLNAGNRYA